MRFTTNNNYLSKKAAFQLIFAVNWIHISNTLVFILRFSLPLKRKHLQFITSVTKNLWYVINYKLFSSSVKKSGWSWRKSTGAMLLQTLRMSQCTIVILKKDVLMGKRHLAVKVSPRCSNGKPKLSHAATHECIHPFLWNYFQCC